MTVKDVICETLYCVGRSDAALELSSKSSGFSEEVNRLVRACLTYLNAVCDELARGYFPVYYEEELSESNGVYYFGDFAYPPVEIKSVTEDGKAVEWYLSDGKLITSAQEIKVYYSYSPSFSLLQRFSYPRFEVSARLVEYGILAEYFLVLGDATSSAVWEAKYRNEIEDILTRNNVNGRIPPRRWI